MTKNIEKRLDLGQVTLQYQYESAKNRMELHPNRASKCLEIIKHFPHFENLDEALDFAQQKEQEKRFCGGKIFATIRKDEEYYYIDAPWLVVNGRPIADAEFIGLCFIADANEVLNY